mmetsp:Transcript_52977/g.158578  ORF Transcript_52977/g.158578 Transcript_52977/m.158578 type:complete len:925 (-) Transcript_52977:219-2993(-)
MKRSRERRATRRSAAPPIPPPGSGSDEDGADARQKQDDEKTSIVSASAAAKRKRQRTRTRNPLPQSSATDKTPTRSKRSKRDGGMEKAEAGRGNSENPEKTHNSDATSDSSEEDDEITISQLANRASSDKDENDDAQEIVQSGPQVPSRDDLSKRPHEETNELLSRLERDRKAPSSRPNRVKERDKSGIEKSKRKRPFIEIGSESLSSAACRSLVGDALKSNGSEQITDTSRDYNAVKESKKTADQSNAIIRSVRMGGNDVPDGTVSSASGAHVTERRGHSQNDRYSEKQPSDAKRRRVLKKLASGDKGSLLDRHKGGAERDDKRTCLVDQNCGSMDGTNFIHKSSNGSNFPADMPTGHETNKGIGALVEKQRLRGDGKAAHEQRDGQQTQMNISDSFPSVDSIKIELYMEGIRVHRGRGSERRFSDYWDALNRYISSGSQAEKCCRNRSSHAIESELKSFLKTKQLRSLHNRVILAIMKRSLEGKVPTAMYRRHLPPRWKRQAQLKSSEAQSPPSSSTGAVARKEKVVGDDFSASLQQQKDATDIQKLSSYFGRDTDLWTSFARRKIGNDFTSAAVQFNRRESPERIVSEASLRSATLPGALSIDPKLRGLVGKHGMAVSENAVWLLVVAVRAHASAVLRRTIAEMEATKGDQVTSVAAAESQENSKSSTKDEKKIPSSARSKMGDAKVEGAEVSDSFVFEQRKTQSTITVFDLALALSSNPALSSGAANISKSRVAWERCISAANGTLSAPFQPRVTGISRSILAAGKKREEALSAPVSKKVRALTNPGVPSAGTNKSSITANVDSSSTSVAASATVKDTAQKIVHGGKDLSAMKKTAGSSVASEVADSNTAENGDASPNRPSSTSPGPARRGRGTGAKNLAAMRAGAKNLAAMRARRTTSTGSKTDEKEETDTQDQEVKGD